MSSRWKTFKQFIKDFLCGGSVNEPAAEHKEIDDSVKKFVEDTILQIGLGVAAARETLENKETKGWINLVKEEDAKKGNFPTQLIEFDISLNTVLANKVGGGVEVKAVLNMASEHSHNNENLSRAKFCVPITLPCTILKNELVVKMN